MPATREKEIIMETVEIVDGDMVIVKDGAEGIVHEDGRT